MIAITTLSTLLGVFMGSEIADNIIEEDKNLFSENNDSQTFEDD